MTQNTESFSTALTDGREANVKCSQPSVIPAGRGSTSTPTSEQTPAEKKGKSPNSFRQKHKHTRSDAPRVLISPGCAERIVLFLSKKQKQKTPAWRGSGGGVAAFGSRHLGVGWFWKVCGTSEESGDGEESESLARGWVPSQPQGWLRAALFATLTTTQAESQHFVCSFRQDSLFPRLCLGL